MFGSILFLIAALVFAKIGSLLAERFKQPSVLGELIIGVLGGSACRALELTFVLNLIHPHSSILTAVTNGDLVAILPEVGILSLMFLIGIETKITQLLQVGRSSLQVAVLGMLLPFSFGIGIALFVFHIPILSSLFIAGTLSATSVAVTTRVFYDLNQAQAVEARVILGAAIIDDVLGLILLAIITALSQHSNLNYSQISALLVFVILSTRYLKYGRAFKQVSFLFSAILCMTMAILSEKSGLSSIVGAFVAGLGLASQNHLAKDFKRVERWLAPLYFFLIGFQVDMEQLAHPDVLQLAAILSAGAVITKWLSGWASRDGRRWLIGAGMIPRGEVGLIFAFLGHTLGAINDAQFSAIVAMVITTTLVTPLILNVTAHHSGSL